MLHTPTKDSTAFPLKSKESELLDIIKAYKSFGKPLDKYLTTVVAPITIAMFFVVIVLTLVIRGIVGTGFVLYLMVLLPVLVATATILYPIILFERRKVKIDQDMHLFITRLGVLSGTDVAKKGMFNVLSQMKEFGELAVEITKIYHLVEDWGISIAEACRTVAEITPSDIFADFLIRFALSVESGESTEIFFTSEQVTVMDQYAIKYNAALTSCEIMKELYISMVTSAVFIVVIITILPLLSGQQGVTQLYMAAFILVMIEVLFLYLFNSVMPHERVWQTSGIKTKIDKPVNMYLVLSIVLCLAVGCAGVIFALRYIPTPFILAATVTPLILVGYYVNKMEKIILHRDDNFPAFMRSLGGSTEAMGVAAKSALKKLRLHKFGPLTENIDDLYKRLSMNVDGLRSWEFFGAETGSDLVSKFSRVYMEGTKAGGRPGHISRLISDNFIKLLGLRKQRYQSAANLTGILYGISVAITFPLFITVNIVDRIVHLFTKISVPTGYESFVLLKVTAYDVPLLTTLIFIIVIVHAFFSAIMARVVSGGNKLGAMTHFVIMVWIAAIVAVGVEFGLKLMMG